MMRSTICLCVLLAIPAKAGESHLAGTWTGTAQKSACGQSAGSVDIILILQDKNHKSPDDASGDITGTLIVGSAKDGTVDLRYDAKKATAVSSLGSVRANTGLSLSTIASATNYWINLKAGDASWGGFGTYQSLTGTPTTRNSSCMNLVDRGDVLTVTLKTLKKQ
jgi:hypothetical protein